MLKGNRLPNNVDELKEIINRLETDFNKAQQQVDEKTRELKVEKFKYLVLEEKFQILQRKFFGRKSEKISEEDDGQRWLFNEAELGKGEEVEEPTDDSQKIIVKSHTRSKKRKDTFPSHLPEKEEVHAGSEEEKTCPCCGKERPHIDDVVTREIDIIPEQIRIIKHVQKTYGPCDCEGFRNEELPEVITIKKPKRFIPGIIASMGLLACIFISKFLDSLPFYRQEKRFARLGIDISRTNMCNWMIGASEKCQDLLDVMWKDRRNTASRMRSAH